MFKIMNASNLKSLNVQKVIEMYKNSESFKS